MEETLIFRVLCPWVVTRALFSRDRESPRLSGNIKAAREITRDQLCRGQANSSICSGFKEANVSSPLIRRDTVLSGAYVTARA